MIFKFTESNSEELGRFRRLFLHENNIQIIRNSYFSRGFAESYLIESKGENIGYLACTGHHDFSEIDCVFEYYLLPNYRKNARQILSDFLKEKPLKYIDCQTNEALLSTIFFELTDKIKAKAILFENEKTTNLSINQAIFRKRKSNDDIFEHHAEPVGDFVLEKNHEVIATGGFLHHYNFPYADLFMEVKSEFRQQGFGSYLIQELKNEVFKIGKVPAARCNPTNIASKSTLLKAGFRVAGYILVGEVKG